MEPIRFKFNGHGLGDVAHFVHAVQLYRSRGYEVQVQVEDNKRFLWEVAGVTIVPGEDFPGHSYHYPWGFEDLNVDDHATNKVSFGLHHEIMPPLEKFGLTHEAAWDELCKVRLSAHDHIPQHARDEVTKFLEGMPRPIICLHSRGTNWHERKSLPTEVAFDLILRLLDQTPGSVIVLDYDRRAPMVGDARCKGIKPSWGHIGVDKLCALLESSDLLIGIDSGPFHAASFTQVKCLGVFRSLHPNRVCLPNPNATYLASGAHLSQWQRRNDRWNIATYDGEEPTADDIVHEAIKILQGATNAMESRMLLAEFAGWYDYNRVGHDNRKIELLPNGKIGTGSADCEIRWFARLENGVPVIAISGKVGVICDCTKRLDGRFYGRWTQFERMPIELTPIATPLQLEPSRTTLVLNWDEDDDHIAQLVLPNRRNYAARHGYRMHEATHAGPWGKLSAILDVWDTSDWIWWLDADACITNMDTKLETLIEHAEPATSIILTCDHNGLCCGSMLMRTRPSLRSIIDEVLRSRTGVDSPNGLMGMLWKINREVHILPQQAMNSFASLDCPFGSHAWKQGDFVLHCAGLKNEDRVRLLGKGIANEHQAD